MGWIILIAILYAPIIYTINQRLRTLETKLSKMEGELDKLRKT